MTTKIGPPQTGTPTAEGIYVVRYKFRLNEHIVWWDGGRFSIPYANTYEAAAANKIGQRLERGHRGWWPVSYWREYTDDGQRIIDALKQAMGDG